MDMNQRRRELYGLMGDLPPRDRKVSAKTIGRETRDAMEVERLELDLNGIEAVKALMIKPAKASSRLPAILFNHSHGGLYKVGKMEVLQSAPYMQQTAWAADLAGRGYAVLSIDHWCFGERATRTEGACFREMLWRGRVMWGMMVYDSLKALDYLCERGDVEAKRIGTLGMSMGSTMAWWVAALDERIRCCVDICCLTDFDALIEAKGLEGHGIYYYVPSLMKHFTAGEINALIAPRAHLGLQGVRDSLTPVKGLKRIDAEMKAAYAKAGAPDRWKMSCYDVPHQETPEMRQEALAFLDKHLKG